MRRIIVSSLACLVALGFALALPAQEKKDQAAPVVPPRQGKTETIQLFNGVNLDGWEGYPEYWSVKDGVIVGKNTKPVDVSTYLLTRRKFSDFRLDRKSTRLNSSH